MSKPITPFEAKLKRTITIPNEVYDSFNELIVKELNGNTAVIKQKDIVSLIKEKTGHEENSIIFKNKWLDIEEEYIKSGWSVIYDRPGFNESYEPTFTFKMKRNYLNKI